MVHKCSACTATVRYKNKEINKGLAIDKEHQRLRLINQLSKAWKVPQIGAGI